MADIFHGIKKVINQYNESRKASEIRRKKERIRKEEEQTAVEVKGQFGDYLNDLEDFLTNLEENPDQLIELKDERLSDLIASIYNSFFRSAVSSLVNSLNEHEWPEDEKVILSPLLKKWKDRLENGIKLDEQDFEDFKNDLKDFDIKNPTFFNGTGTLFDMFEKRVWTVFDSSFERAKDLIQKIKKLTEKKHDKIEVMLATNFAFVDPFEFESFIGDLFTKMGYKTKVTNKTGDFGVDVIATNQKDVIAVQVKKYEVGNNVGNRDVQRLLGAMQLKSIKANKAILITTSDFTIMAQKQADETPIELWSKDILHSMVRKYFIEKTN